MGVATVGSDTKNYDMTFEQRQRDLRAAEQAEERKRKEAKNSPFQEFAQVNTNHESSVARRQLIKISPIAAQIWEFLVEKADRYNAVVCSSKVLEEALGYGRTSICNAIKILKERNFVDVKKSSTTNVYILNKQLIWKSWGKNYKYAEFDAKVIISESEQEKPTKSKKVNMVEMKNN